jgi:hypothetical protein
MPKFFKKTLILIIITAIFLAPVSGEVGVNDKGNLAVEIEANAARALDSEEFAKMANEMKVNLTAVISGEKKSIKIKITIPEKPTIQCKDNNDCSEKIPMLVFLYEKPDKTKEGDGWEENGILRNITKEYEPIKDFSYLLRNKTEEINFENLNKKKDYLVSLVVYTNRESLIGPWEKAAAVVSPIAGILVATVKIKELLSKTPAALEYFYLIKSDTTDGDLTTGIGSGVFNAYWKQQPLKLGCSLDPWKPNLIGCIAGIFYMIWEVSAVIARFAGNILDFFVYYSTNSSSYTNEFVSQAWGAVRDIANIFFIIALLYVAIKTILGLNVTDNKRLVGAVIIIALIINFSLFTTKVVIDGSNILAKVFYNNITSKDEKGALATGASGQKSISVGLIEKYNPQKLLDADQSKAQQKYDSSPGTFIFYTVLLIVITLYTAYIFFSVALLFVARVVSLWLAMIFSPIAFASYTVPFDIPGFGHKEWWKNLMDAALLAPIFIFMLYIIILFAGFLKTITDNTDSLLTVTIPFIILAVLLTKAKSIAVKFSGEIGAMIQKAGAVVGGVALGAATGGMAMAGRATIGRAGAAIANSATLKNAEARGIVGARQLRNIGKFTGSGSMDIRGIKVGGKGLADTGLTSLGTPKEGGFTKRRADQVEKRQKRAKELEVGEDETLKQNLNKVEEDLQSLLRANSHDLETLDKRIAAARQNANDLNSKETTDPNLVNTRKAAIAAASALPANDPTKAAALATATAMDIEDPIKVAAKKEANDKLAELKAHKDAIKKAQNFTPTALTAIPGQAAGVTIQYSTTNRINNRSIEDLENDAIPHAHAEIEKENRKRKWDYADSEQGAWSQTINFITSGGQHSFAGEKEAGHKIKMEEKLDSGKKDGGH